MSNGTSTAYWPPGRAAAPPEYTVSVRGRGLTSAEAGSHPDLTMLSQPAFLAQREAGVPSRHSRVEEMPPLLLHREEEEEVGCTCQVRDGGRAAHLPYSRPAPTAHCPPHPCYSLHSATTTTPQSQFFSEKPHFSELSTHRKGNGLNECLNFQQENVISIFCRHIALFLDCLLVVMFCHRFFHIQFASFDNKARYSSLYSHSNGSSQAELASYIARQN